jgi:type I restriction enzyme M protein
MALKKSELYSSLWASCDELRGSMDASQYKDYVLVLLFVKYVSDRYAGEPYVSTHRVAASGKNVLSMRMVSETCRSGVSNSPVFGVLW